MVPPSDAGSEGIDVAGPSDAPPIVMVHGAVFTRKMWVPQREMLSGEFRVVAPDLPGHGERSAWDFHLPTAIELVDNTIEAVGGSAYLVGLSLGGYVSTMYAGRNPDSVDGLVISGSSANPVRSFNALSRGIGGLTRLVTRSERIENGLKELTKRWVRGRDLPRAQEDEIIDAGFYPRQFGVGGKELAGRDFRGMFASYPGPALVLNGERDMINRRGESEHAAAAPDARVEVVDGVGHVCNLHRPAAYTDALRRFYRQSVTQQVGVE